MRQVSLHQAGTRLAAPIIVREVVSGGDRRARGGSPEAERCGRCSAGGCARSVSALRRGERDPALTFSPCEALQMDSSC